MNRAALIVIAAAAVGAAGINQKVDASALPLETKHPSCLVEYTISEGDTLAQIAATHQTTVAAIAHKNQNLTNVNIIETGETLCISSTFEESNQTNIGQSETSPTLTIGTISVPATDGPRGSETLQPPAMVLEAVQKHFADLGAERVTQALTIARCESTYRNVHRGISPVTGDYGIFQINYLHAKPGELLPKMGLTLDDVLNSADLNAQVARKLYDRRSNRGQPVWEDWKQSRHCHNQHG